MTATVDHRRRDLAAPPAPFTSEQEARIRELIVEGQAVQRKSARQAIEELDLSQSDLSVCLGRDQQDV